MNLEEIHNFVSTHLPDGGMGVGGIVLCLVAFKWCRGKFRLVLILVALGLLAGAVWWYRQHR